jgi:alkylation response protein AidB-like acyl-CoA dehydrogenase
LGLVNIRRLRELAWVALAAEQVGAASRALALTVEYVKIRVQFGRPVGAFQAIQHRLADLYVLVETARSAYLAAVADGGGTSAAIARIHCGETLSAVAAEMIQLHGGIGITWEHDAHRYFKRAHSSALLFGAVAQCEAELSELVMNLSRQRSALAAMVSDGSARQAVPGNAELSTQ